MARKGPNWDWPFQNLGFGELCCPICLGAWEESWTAVCMPKLPPIWHFSAPPASQGHNQKEHAKLRSLGQAKGTVHRERSQLNPQDIFLSLPCKYMLIYSATNQNIHPPSLSKIRPLWRKTPCSYLASPVLWAAESRLHTDGFACLSSALLWEAANDDGMPPGQPLSVPEIPANCTLPHESKSTLEWAWWRDMVAHLLSFPQWSSYLTMCLQRQGKTCDTG